MKNIVDIVRRRIFGYDIFISYSRNDGLNYSYAIAQYFLDKGYECYIDQLSSTTPGAKLPRNIQNAVTRSTSFVLVGSSSAQKSEPIAKEVKLFLEHSKNQPIIPISIDQAINENAIWYSDIQGLAFILDTQDNLVAGAPSEEVLDRIENALAFTKKSDRLRKIFFSTLIAIALIICVAFYIVNKTTQELDQAEGARIEAERLTSVAVQEKEQADEEVIKKTGELANTQAELTQRLKRLTALDTELLEKQKDLITADLTRQNVEGNLASQLSSQRTKEREALNMGLSAITSSYTNKSTAISQKGLSDAYHNYLVYRPIPIDNITNIYVHSTNTSLVVLRAKNEVLILDSETTLVKNRWKLASTRGTIKDVDISEDGQFLTYIIEPNYGETQQDYELVIRNAENGTIIFSKNSEEIISHKLSPKGTYVLINTAESGTLWNLKTNTKTSIPQGNVKETLFSNYENVMVIYDKKEYPKVWNLRKQVTFMHEVKVEPEKISSLHLSEYGEAVFIGQNDNEIGLWNTNGGKLYNNLFEGHSKEPYFYKIMTLDEGDQPGDFARSTGGYFSKHNNMGINDIHLTTTRKGERIVTASNDQSAILWSLDGRLIRKTYGHEYEVTHAKFSKDGLYLATVSKEKVLLSDAANGRPLDSFEISEHEIKDVSFLEKDKLVILLKNGASYIWTFFRDTSLYTFNHCNEDFVDPQYTEYASLNTLDYCDKTIASARFTPDNKNIITTDWNGNISLWDTKGQLLMHKVYYGYPKKKEPSYLDETLDSLGIDWMPGLDQQSGRNEPLYEEGFDPFERLHLDEIGNAADPKPGERPKWGPLLSSSIAPDEKTIICQNSDGVGIVYRLEKDSIRFVSHFLLEEYQVIEKAAFIKNGTEIVIKPMFGSNCYIVETETGKTLKTLPKNDFDKYDKTHPLEAKAKKIIDIHFHPNLSYRYFKITPDNKYFITVGMDRMVHLFRLSDGAVLSAFRAHTGRIYEVTISNDGKYFLTIGEDRTAKLFETPYLNTIKKNAKELLKN